MCGITWLPDSRGEMGDPPPGPAHAARPERRRLRRTCPRLRTYVPGPGAWRSGFRLRKPGAGGSCRENAGASGSACHPGGCHGGRGDPCPAPVRPVGAGNQAWAGHGSGYDKTPQRRSAPQVAPEQRRQITTGAASGLRHVDKRLRIQSDRGRILLKRRRREDGPPEPRTLSLQCRRRRTPKAASGHFRPHHSGAACPAARANRREHRQIRNPPPMRPGGNSSILIPRRVPGNGEAGSYYISP